MTTPTYDRLRSKLVIDKDALDTELVETASRFMDAAEATVAALQRRDTAIDARKTMTARLSAKYRVSLPLKGIKVTEAAILSAVAKNKEYGAAVAEERAAAEEYDRMDALREAFRMRHTALRSLVDLHLSSHYATGGSSATAGYEDSRRRMADARRAGSRTRPAD